jgi:hypothetical protein
MTNKKIPPEKPPGDEAAELLADRLDPIEPAVPETRARIVQRVLRRTASALNGARVLPTKGGKRE